ncbi:MAG: hypothetical protein HQM11_00490 [SAR324 cluster bacterium]|nr:hypothetical protein [SAR324 cluster bacterium]
MLMIIRLLILGMLGYAAFKLYKKFSAGLFQDMTKSPKTAKDGGITNTVMDPECGVFIDTNTAYVAKINGEQQYFCGKTCADAFRQKQEQHS